MTTHAVTCRKVPIANQLRAQDDDGSSPGLIASQIVSPRRQRYLSIFTDGVQSREKGLGRGGENDWGGGKIVGEERLWLGRREDVVGEERRWLGRMEDGWGGEEKMIGEVGRWLEERRKWLGRGEYVVGEEEAWWGEEIMIEEEGK
ncbi:hypothetical protein Pcinc_002982 [Petrolisthes cinctipes]|uniref:Uncharacterized protein n=1 Tax=Petrolisthes cinctipes TaxID=88211 RepID=A0AAE1GK85_PETCI|nr:hypothetical protein Pcinc_002982 [Petrolisthes cinctipes]